MCISFFFLPHPHPFVSSASLASTWCTWPIRSICQNESTTKKKSFQVIIRRVGRSYVLFLPSLPAPDHEDHSSRRWWWWFIAVLWPEAKQERNFFQQTIYKNAINFHLKHRSREQRAVETRVSFPLFGRSCFYPGLLILLVSVIYKTADTLKFELVVVVVVLLFTPHRRTHIYLSSSSPPLSVAVARYSSSCETTTFRVWPSTLLLYPAAAVEWCTTLALSRATNDVGIKSTTIHPSFLPFQLHVTPNLKIYKTKRFFYSKHFSLFLKFINAGFNVCK